VEEQLEKIWKEILGLETIGRKASFFSIGGQSLKIMQLLPRVQQSLGVALRMQDVFAHPTIEEQAGFIGKAKTQAYIPVTRSSDLEYHPLSYAQQRLWFIHQLGGEHGLAYNIPGMVRISGEVNEDRLNKGLQLLVERHAGLRTSFHLSEGKPVQKIHAVLPQEARVAKSGKIYRDEEIHALLLQEMSKPFDLQKPALMRWTLAAAGDGYVLLAVMHHIITDHWSMNVLMRELLVIYHSLSQGAVPQLPELPVTYTDYVHWQKGLFESGAFETQYHYWEKQLRGMPPLLELPWKNGRPKVQTYSGALKRIQLPGELYRGLEKFCEQEGCTLFMAMMTAFAALLSKYSGQHGLVIGYPVANRSRRELEPLVGFFANTLVMCLEADRAGTLRQLAQQVKEKTIEAYDNQDYPFEKLVERWNPKRNTAYSPVFQVMLSVQQEEGEAAGLTALKLTETAGAKFDLNLIADASGGTLSLGIEYNTDLFDPRMVERMMEQLQHIIGALPGSAEQQLGSLPLATQNEKTLLHKWNDTTVNYGETSCVHRLFERRAAEHPHAPALRFAGVQLSYEELNRQSNQLANYLVQQGVVPDAVVGICMERSVEMMIAILAVLKAGGAYLPLDPSLPQARLLFMAEDAGAALVLAHKGFGQKLSGGPKLLDWEHISNDLVHQPQEDPSVPLSLHNLAYVIYTSGSTGKPKGVMNEHGGLLNRLLWMQDVFRIGSSDKILQKTPFSFDVSVWEFLWPLMAGSCVVMALPEVHKDVAYLVDAIEAEGITLLHFVPSMLEVFVSEVEQGRCSSIKRVLCSGEALSKGLQERFFEKMRCELHNLYGPTEASIDVSWWKCVEDWDRDYVPIGRPIANTQLYILDEGLQPVPIGVAGELHIGGAGLARGYINNEALTKEKFIGNPFNNNSKLYKTGDLARYTEEGLIQYLGRTDHQVKLRGQRIELGEIEAALMAYPGIQHAAVLLKPAQGGHQLVAYYSAKENSNVLSSALRPHLLQHLPEYMVPAFYVQLDEMPLTISGKTDRLSLVKREIGPVDNQAGYVAPVTATELKLAELWKRLLPVEKPGIDDDFFSLGGHSLMAMEALSGIEEIFQLKLPVTQFFEDNTIRKLGGTIDKFIGLREAMESSVIEEAGSETLRI
jgi:surfactin family lipopeptide synthetase A